MTDLEIYLRNAEPEAIAEWLEAHLDGLAFPLPTQGRMLKGAGQYRDQPVQLSLYPEAAGKQFHCLVMEGESLPWQSDLDCARSAWRALDKEVRCSPGGWAEGDPVEENQWWKLDQHGEKLITWTS